MKNNSYKIPLMRNAFLEEQKTRIELSQFILNAGRLSMSKKCKEFESEFSEIQETRHAVLFNSGGSANLALLQALKNLGRIKTGARVGFSALTWSTNVMPIIQLGLEAIPLDCELNTLNLSSEILKDYISKNKLDVLFITNVLGFVDDIEEIKNVCDNNDIILIEDNCESLGTRTKQGLTGNFGLGSTFSFYVAHHMSTIEGGMVCTQDDDLNEMLKITRANGWDRNLSENQKTRLRAKYGIKSSFQASYTFYDLGFNLRPTEITGFLGLQQLKYLKEAINKRNQNYMKIKDYISRNNDFKPLRSDHIPYISTFAFPFVCKSEEIREKYLAKFIQQGIEIRPMIAGDITLQPFFKKYIKKNYTVPNTTFLHNCGFYSGNYPELSQEDLKTIISQIN